jgi:hypothetical protein
MKGPVGAIIEVVPRAPRGRRVWWLAGLLLVVAMAPFLVRGRDVLRPLRRLLTTRVLSPFRSPPATSTPPPVEEAMLGRQLRGLTGLVAEADAGALFPDAPDRVLVVVDQGLIQRLLTALTPYEHIVADRYRVAVTGARVVFEDGFALVRLDGRASLAGVVESEVFADLTVVGDLELPPEQQKRDVLKARIHVLAVDARLVAVGRRTGRAEELVEELSRTKLEAFAALASSLEIPVRQEQEITIPGVGPEGPVRIAAASLPLRLALIGVHAFHGKLWIAMRASIGTSSLARDELALARERGEVSGPPRSPPIAGAVGGGTAGPDLRGLSRDERLVRLHEEYRRRHEQFETLLAREALIGDTERAPGDIVLAVRAGLVKAVALEAVRRYIDRVALDLSGIEVTKSGELQADTFLGKVTAGRWTVDVNLHHIRGTLRAGAPRIELKSGNEVELDLPVLIEEGEGTAAVRFAWHSHGMARIVCRSFETTQEVSGHVKPEEYPVTGSFLLATVKDALTATPRFDPTFRVKVEPSRESWAKVRAALEAQDDITRCGLAFDPDKVFAQLQDLVGKGFVIHLPRKLLRTVTLPAGVTESVDVEGRRVAVVVTRNALRITPEGLWYSIGLRADISGAPRPGARDSPRP